MADVCVCVRGGGAAPSRLASSRPVRPEPFARLVNLLAENTSSQPHGER